MGLILKLGHLRTRLKGKYCFAIVPFNSICLTQAMRRDKIFAEAVANIHTLQSPGYGVSMDDESRKIPTAAEIFYKSLKT